MTEIKFNPDSYSSQICLAVVDRSTVYYLHRSHCKEVRTDKSHLEKTSPSSASQSLASQSTDQNEGPVRTANISLVPDSNSVTVKWNVTVVQESDEVKASRDEIYTLIRRISLRPFGTDNVTRLFVLEDFNLTSLASHKSPPSPRYYTLNHLSPSTAYVICFETLPDPAPDEGEDEQRAEARKGRKSEEKESRNNCWETETLDEEAGFPVAEVATAAAVSTSTTAFVFAVVCCCCFPGLCKKKKEDEKIKETEKTNEVKGEEVRKDENDNESQMDGQPKLRAHLSRRHHRDDGSRCSASPGNDLVGFYSNYLFEEMIRRLNTFFDFL